MYFLGCPMWANDKWRNQLFTPDCLPTDFLAQYSQYFNAVEGNTTFYADPTEATIARWMAQSAEHFRFCFKVPKQISHQLNGAARLDAAKRWCALMQPIANKIGLIHLQFSERMQACHLSEVAELITVLQHLAPVAMEVRHPDFFNKGPAEIALHQLLRQLNTERVVLDSRCLFQQVATTPALADAQRHKPRLAVHAVAIGTRPMLRFIGVAHLAANRDFYAPWLTKTQQWINEGRTPYLFFHTEDNVSAPLLARQFAQDLQTQCGINHPVLQAWPNELQPLQATLF